MTTIQAKTLGAGALFLALACTGSSLAAAAEPGPAAPPLPPPDAPPVAPGPAAPGPATPPPQGAYPPPPPGAPPPPPPAYAPGPPGYGGRSEGYHLHDGFYLRMGLGGGFVSSSLNVDVPSTVKTNYTAATIQGGGGAFDIAIGGTPVKGLALGGAFMFSQAMKPNVKYGSVSATATSDLNFGLLGFFADYFFDAEGGGHLGAAVGPAILTVTDQAGTTQATAKGFGGALFGGYDWWVSDNWSLGILARFAGARTSTSMSVSAPTYSVSITETESTFTGALMFSALYH